MRSIRYCQVYVWQNDVMRISLLRRCSCRQRKRKHQPLLKWLARGDNMTKTTTTTTAATWETFVVAQIHTHAIR